jgi:hypothetical protein
MNNNPEEKMRDRPEYFYQLEELLDKHFPKGECKERGAALMMFAETNLLVKSLLTQQKDRLLEKVGEKRKREQYDVHTKDFIPMNSTRIVETENKGYNLALEDVEQIIKEI